MECFEMTTETANWPTEQVMTLFILTFHRRGCSTIASTKALAACCCFLQKANHIPAGVSFFLWTIHGSVLWIFNFLHCKVGFCFFFHGLQLSGMNQSGCLQRIHTTDPSPDSTHHTRSYIRVVVFYVRVQHTRTDVSKWLNHLQHCCIQLEPNYA